jgi:ubiquitin carboxyl-terminal hydrolase 1
MTINWYRAEEARLAGTAPASSPSSNASSSTQSSFAALSDLSTTPATSSKKRRSKDARRIHTRLQQLLDASDASCVGQAVPGLNVPVKWQWARPGSTRQSMITRPPAILRCHLVRSEYTNWGTVVKKTARIAFPAVLEFTPHMAWNVWDEEDPSAYVLEPQDLSEAVKTIGKRRKLLYRLESVICHYGYTHSFGHFVAYRRRPIVNGETARPAKGTKACPDGCICNTCIFAGQVRSTGEWLRISDADVEVVNEADVLAERANVFMVFYQRVEEVAVGTEVVLEDARVPVASNSVIQTAANGDEEVESYDLD